MIARGIWAVVTAVATSSLALSPVAAQDSALDRSLSSVSERLAQVSRLPRGTMLAVLPLVDSTGHETSFGRFMANELTTKLFETGAFQLVERSLLASAIRELRLQGSGITNPRTAARLGRLVNADAILIGSYEDVGKSRRLNLRIISVARGTIVGAAGANLLREALPDPVAQRSAQPGPLNVPVATRAARKSGPLCTNVPAGAPVDANGCAKDTDGDGVPDYSDRCPNTPRGAAVDAGGCSVGMPAPEARPTDVWSNRMVTVRAIGAVRRGRDVYVTVLHSNVAAQSAIAVFLMTNLQDQFADYLSDDLGNRYPVAAGSMFASGANPGYASANVTLPQNVPTRFQLVFVGVSPEATSVTLVLPWGVQVNSSPSTVTLGPIPLR